MTDGQTRHNQQRTLRAATPVKLHRWTLHASEGTEHAAIPRQRLQQFSTPLALVVVQARIDGHLFLGGNAAFGTGDDGAQYHWHSLSTGLYPWPALGTRTANFATSAARTPAMERGTTTPCLVHAISEPGFG